MVSTAIAKLITDHTLYILYAWFTQNEYGISMCIAIAKFVNSYSIWMNPKYPHP